MESMAFREFLNVDIRDLSEADRSFSHPISDESIDAHGSIIRLSGWDTERFKRNPIVLFAHDRRGLPVGNSENVWKRDGRLMTRTQFVSYDASHPLGPVWTLASKGYLRGWSVGFMPRKWRFREDLSEEERRKFFDPTEYLEQELFEYSLVPIPSNPNAISDARQAGVNVEPYLAWMSQYRDLVDFCTRQRIALPGLNDQIEVKAEEALTDEMDVLLETHSIAIVEPSEDERQEGFTMQTLIFPFAHWKSADDCKKWAKEHDFKNDKVDKTGNSWRLRQREPGEFIRLRGICVMPNSEKFGSDKCRVKGVGGPLKKAKTDEKDEFDLSDDIERLIIEETMCDM